MRSRPLTVFGSFEGPLCKTKPGFGNRAEHPRPVQGAPSLSVRRRPSARCSWWEYSLSGMTCSKMECSLYSVRVSGLIALKIIFQVHYDSFFAWSRPLQNGKRHAAIHPISPTQKRPPKVATHKTVTTINWIRVAVIQGARQNGRIVITAICPFCYAVERYFGGEQGFYIPHPISVSAKPHKYRLF